MQCNHCTPRGAKANNRIAVSLNALQLFQCYIVWNGTKLLLLHCCLKTIKIVNNTAADWAVILIGYSSKSLQIHSVMFLKLKLEYYYVKF